MLPQSVLGAKHLAEMLVKALQKEKEQWKPRVFRKDVDLEVCEEHRNDAVNWLLTLNHQYDFCPECMGLAIATLDQFLQLVKVRPKYLRCVAVSCFYLAAKTLEEDEVIPSTTDLVRGSQSGCTVAEVCRMERLILDKLNWNIKSVTAVDFLYIIHALILSRHPHLLDGVSNMTPAQHLQVLTEKLLSCLCQGSLMLFPPVTLALALVSLELEQFTASWFPVVTNLQKMVKIDNRQLIHCREQLARHLGEKRLLQTCYRFSADHSRQPAKPRSNKRKVDLMVEEVDEIYDSIKRLYSEDLSPDEASSGAGMGVAVRVPCRLEAHQEPLKRSFAAVVAQSIAAT